MRTIETVMTVNEVFDCGQHVLLLLVTAARPFLVVHFLSTNHWATSIIAPIVVDTGLVYGGVCRGGLACSCMHDGSGAQSDTLSCPV